MRFDYALRENADKLFENLESASESQPNDFTRPTVRDNLLRDYTFSFDSHRISPHFESVEVRAVEANYGFVEIVSVAEVDPAFLLNVGMGLDVGNRHQAIERLERGLESVRTWIPEEEQGCETTLFWADVYPKEDILTDLSPNAVATDFSDGAERRFLQDFRVRHRQGTITFGDKRVMFLGGPRQMFGHGLVIELDNGLTGPSMETVIPGNLGIQIPEEFASLSKLYGTHYWCKSRGKELDTFEEEFSEARDDLPAINSLNPTEYLDLDSNVYELQENWTRLHSRIPSEQEEILEQIQSISIDHKDTGSDTPDIMDLAGEGGILEGYISSLEREVEQIESDEKRVNDVFNALSEYTSNQLSAVASRERERASKESQRLQRKVYWLTFAVTVLTVVLTLDALLIRGLGQFVYNLTMNQAGASHQVWNGLMGILALLVILLSPAIGTRK